MAMAQASRSGVSIDRMLLWCGVVAGPLFVATFLLEGAIAPGYDPLRHPVSSLALSPSGWMQIGNFLVAGTLYLACAAGLARAPRATVGTRAGVLLVAAVAVGLLGSGVFITDPISGYPPGTPSANTTYSGTAAALHDLFGVLVFLGLPAAAIVFGRWFLRQGDRGFGWYAIGTGLAMLVLFALTSAAFAQVPALVAFGGLLQRGTIIVGLAWLTALALRTLRTLPDG